MRSIISSLACIAMVASTVLAAANSVPEIDDGN